MKYGNLKFYTAIYRAIHQQPQSRMTREKHGRENRSLVVSSQFLILARPGADRAQGSPNLQGREGESGCKSGSARLKKSWPGMD